MKLELEFKANGQSWAAEEKQGRGRENGGGDRGAPNFVHKVHHTPYFEGYIVECALKQYSRRNHRCLCPITKNLINPIQSNRGL